MDLNDILKGTGQAPAQTAAPVAQTAPVAQGDIFAGLDAELDNSLKNAGGFENIPAGDYLVTIKKVTLKLSQKGTPMFVIAYQVIDGDKANRYETQFITLVGKDGKWSTRGLGDFVALVTEITKDKSEAGKEKARAMFKAIWTEFNNKGKEDMAVEGFDGINGKLTITETEAKDNPHITFRNQRFTVA